MAEAVELEVYRPEDLVYDQEVEAGMLLKIEELTAENAELQVLADVKITGHA